MIRFVINRLYTKNSFYANRHTYSPGTIDSGYRDELGIIVTNTSETRLAVNGLLEVNSKGNHKGTYIIKKGDRIAQLILQRVPRMKLKVVEDVSAIGENRGGGFGSTGVK